MKLFARFRTPRLPRHGQVTGCLIRHREDRGGVAVFDKRLATAGYRRAIVDSPPPFKRTIDGAEAREFLGKITSVFGSESPVGPRASKHTPRGWAPHFYGYS